MAAKTVAAKTAAATEAAVQAMAAMAVVAAAVAMVAPPPVQEMVDPVVVVGQEEQEATPMAVKATGGTEGAAVAEGKEDPLVARATEVMVARVEVVARVAIVAVRSKP